MSKIKIAKRVSFLVTENIKEEADCIEQTYQFWTSNKKYLKYAYDQRYCLRIKLERLFKKDLLPLKFIKRDEYDDKIVFKYEKNGTINNNSKTINCEFYLPPFNGCKYCRKCKSEGDFLYCEEKKKHYDSNGIKNCPIFSSIEEIIS